MRRSSLNHPKVLCNFYKKLYHSQIYVNVPYLYHKASIGVSVNPSNFSSSKAWYDARYMAVTGISINIPVLPIPNFYYK